jgi:hypothetical protein
MTESRTIADSGGRKLSESRWNAKMERIKKVHKSEARWSVILCVLLGIASAGDAALHLARVAVLPEHLNIDLPGPPQCGDANHNGRFEVYGRQIVGEQATIIGYEYVAGDSYQRFSLGDPDTAWGPCAVGDGDGDGLTDLILWRFVDFDTVSYTIAESRDSWSFPTDIVWQTFSAPYGARPKFIDLDRDGRQEIPVCWGNGIRLFENTGDNRYDSVATLPFAPTYYCASFDTGDFDRDSSCELVAGCYDRLYIFEATGTDNQYVLSAVCTLAVDDWVHCVASSGDMDHDGWPEFVVMTHTPDVAELMVYEAEGHGKYCRRWLQEVPFVLAGNEGLAVGDVDGDGTNEFVYSTGGLIDVFKCVGPDDYELAWSIDSGLGTCTVFDINGDGRVEIMFDVNSGADPHYDIYEDTDGLGVSEFTQLPQLHTVTVQPAIARSGAPVMFSGVPPGSDIEVLSLDGRLVSRTSGVRQSTWTWDLRNQSGNLVPAGTYFAVIRSKEKATSLKLCVVK